MIFQFVVFKCQMDLKTFEKCKLPQKILFTDKINRLGLIVRYKNKRLTLQMTPCVRFQSWSIYYPAFRGKVIEDNNNIVIYGVIMPRFSAPILVVVCILTMLDLFSITSTFYDAIYQVGFLGIIVLFFLSMYFLSRRNFLIRISRYINDIGPSEFTFYKPKNVLGEMIRLLR